MNVTTSEKLDHLGNLVMMAMVGVFFLVTGTVLVLKFWEPKIVGCFLLGVLLLFLGCVMAREFWKEL